MRVVNLGFVFVVFDYFVKIHVLFSEEFKVAYKMRPKEFAPFYFAYGSLVGSDTFTNLALGQI